MLRCAAARHHLNSLGPLQLVLIHAEDPCVPSAVEELCAFRWKFRFKPQAGDYWLGLTAGLDMERLFGEDGSVSAPPSDPIWGEGSDNLCV